jgi:hypothetical protein
MTMDRSASSTEYPQASALEESLKHLAIEVGDATAKPFRVNMVRVHGGKPPIYCVLIRSSAKEPLRQRLEQMINRSLSCGISSYMLKANEAARIISGAWE